MAALKTHLSRALERREKAMRQHAADTERAAELADIQSGLAALAAAADANAAPASPPSPGGNYR